MCNLLTYLTHSLTCSNQLGPRAAAALGTLRGLRSLRLFDNPLEDTAALALVEALVSECSHSK